MPKLTIDNIEVEVPAGTNVLEAAKQVGVWVPHFCYHPALGSVGACRLCAVKFQEGPVKGLQMSCMIPAQDGMVVSTTDSEAARMRSLVIEWLMQNHPHDCPVCDEGGECLLQDYTIAGGHALRRFKGPKRTFIPQYLGDYIHHEMNRCIECYRCSRFYQDFAGGTDFGVLGSARRVYFGRFSDGAFESPFSGNLVDICPTGVFTDKTARYRARYWDYQMSPSVCPDCSLGCNILPAARYRELIKIMARRNDAVNGWFICDRARFGDRAVNSPLRPRTPQVDGQGTGWNEALDALVVRLKAQRSRTGPGSIAVVGSARLSLESGLVLAKFAALLEARLCFFTDDAAMARSDSAADLVTGRGASLADVRNADEIVLLDCDLLAEGPMMALAVRQAWRKGATIHAVGTAESVLLVKTLCITVTPVGSLADLRMTQPAATVIICGASGELPPPALLSTGVKLACLFNGPNGMGSVLLARDNGMISLAAAMASGEVQAVIAVEADLPVEFADTLPIAVALDWRSTRLTERAGIILPTTAWLEMDGTFINNEGRAQRFRKSMQPGRPVNSLTPALHPPLVPRAEPPGGGVLPAWQILAELVQRLGGEPVAEPLAGKWQALRELDPEGEGVLIL